MTVAEKSFQMSLGVTMDQSIPIEVLPNDRLADVVNARVRKPGGLYKRYGFTSYPRTRLSDDTNITAGKRFIRRENELAFTDGFFLYSWVQGLNKWVTRDRMPECQVLDRRAQVSDQQNGVILVTNVAHSIGQTCVIIERSAAGGFELWARVFRGDTLINETLLDTGITGLADVLSVGLYFVVIWDDGSNNFIASRWDILDTTNPAWGSPVTLRNDQDSSGFWAAAEIPGLAEFAIVYRRTGGGNQMDLYRFNQALTSTANSLNLRAGKVFDIIGMRTIGTTLTIGFRNTTDNTVEAMGRDQTTLASAFAATVVLATATDVVAPLLVGERTSLSAWIICKSAGSSVSPFVNQPGTRYRGIGVPSATLDITTYDTYNCRPISHPFNYGGHTYLIVAPSNGDIGFDRTQKAALVIDLGTDEVLGGDHEYRARPVARWGEGEIYSVTEAAMTRVPAGDITGTFHAATINTPLDEDRGILADIVTLNFDDIAATRWVGQSQIGGDTLIPAGMLHGYDGCLCFEAGWTYYPIIRGTETLIQGPGLATGVYDYIVCFVWRDMQGRIWRSPPSPPVTAGVDNDPDNAIRLRISHYSITSMHDSANGFAHPACIEVYRRQGTAPFVRLEGGVALPSDPTSQAYLAFIDDGTSTQANQPQLYTTGGVLENHTSRPCRYTQMFDNRLFIAGCDDDEVVQHSREIVGPEGAFFNPELEFRIDDGQGIKTLAAQDSSLLMLKDDNDGIFFIQGNGPNDFGLESTYTNPPRKIANAHGCIEPRSMLTTTAGTFFQSRRGIELCGRGESVQLIGYPIEDTLAGHPTITSCVYEPDSGEIRWAMANDNNGQVGVYTEPTKTWARDVWFGGSGKRSVDACMVGGVYHWLGPTGYVYRENIGAHYDISAGEALSVGVSAGFTTGDIALAGPLGKVSHFRAGLLGKRLLAHDLSVLVTLDQGQTAAATKSFTAAEVGAFKWIPIELPLVQLEKQQGRSIRIAVSDTPTDGEIGSGPIWFHLLVEYGVEERKFQPLPVPVSNRK